MSKIIKMAPFPPSSNAPAYPQLCNRTPMEEAFFQPPSVVDPTDPSPCKLLSPTCCLSRLNYSRDSLLDTELIKYFLILV